MKLYQPNAVLVKKKISESPDVWKYMLYSVTMMDHSRFEADAFDQTVFPLNMNGHYDIKLKVSRNTTIPINKDYLKPVVHIVDLSGVALSDTTPTVSVGVYEDSQLMGDKRTIHKSSADEDAMPDPRNATNY